MFGTYLVNRRDAIRNEDMRAIYSAASHYLRSLYADQPSPHATKDNAIRLAIVAEALHAQVPR
jgi:hypothetical protein